MLKVAVAVPVDEGANVTDTVQEAPAASETPQVFDPTVKRAGEAPPTVTEEMESAAVPAFASVNTFCALLLPVATVPKSAEAGVNAASATGGGLEPAGDSSRMSCTVPRPSSAFATNTFW